MGIGILMSEESSSSAASATTLGVEGTRTTDENLNEGTPNLNAPKLCQNHTYIDDSLLNCTIESTTTDPGNVAQKTKDQINESHKKANNNSKYYNESKQLRKIVVDKSPMKTVALAGTSTEDFSSIHDKSGRSPLATVDYNSHSIKINNNNQNASPLASICNSMYIAQNNTDNYSFSNSNLAANRPLSPNLPSTSRYASMKQQHLKAQLPAQKQQFHFQEPQLQHTDKTILKYEEFFLYRSNNSDRRNHFDKLSDEMILSIFKWLPKKTLLRCGQVSRRFNRCATDESLWARIDLGGRSIRAEAFEHILNRGVVIMRLAQSHITHPTFEANFLKTNPDFKSKLQFLDLSMASISKSSLKMFLSCCRNLKKLSLEHVAVNDEICHEIAENINLEVLNLAMCSGVEAWSVRKMVMSLSNLNSLNISWTNLSVDAITSLVTNLTSNIIRLNIAGCRKTMFDSHLSNLIKRCPQLIELDLSDCTGLTSNAISILCGLKDLEYLSLSRCYLITASSYMELNKLPSLTYLDVFGMLSDPAMELLEQTFPSLGINKFIHSSVARPTVGSRRTSIWGLRTRD